MTRLQVRRLGVLATLFFISTPSIAMAHNPLRFVDSAINLGSWSHDDLGDLAGLDGKTTNSGASIGAKNDSTDDSTDGFTGSGSPHRRSSGGSRGDCSELLVALVPGDRELAVSEAGCNLPSTSNLALTAHGNPVIWVHVPAQSDPVDGEFAVLDDNQMALSIQTIPLPKEAGIVGIQIEAELEVDRTYSWVFSLLADPRNPSENPHVSGQVARIDMDPDLLTQLDAADTLRDQALLWIDQGIWHDALTAVAHLRQSNPTTAAQDWHDFLGSAGLGAIADAPFQDCCY